MVWRIFEYSALISLFCVNSVFTSSYTIDVDKNECMYYTSYQINQFETYEIVWHGYSITGCGLGFYAEGDGIFAIDDYKICVKPVVWNMHDCASRLYLKYNDVKSVFCHERDPDTHCNDAGTKLDIEVKMHDLFAWRVNTTSFTLKVYAKNTTYYGVGLVSACTLLLILILAFCVLIRKRRSSRGPRRSSSSIYSLSGQTTLPKSLKCKKESTI
ncbi:uncharacterized protein LOC125656999 isoform X2 [Ostrea edulis]|uniref:uncharacterized protein LOC125656999 isoform X2 n=1 Tax=Ostrea edulis TaxID=37623 RepID=UPI0024AEEB04|nr:uncharacterized protein LOC125656999 isoform X2 [Ostrea edulis]